MISITTTVHAPGPFGALGRVIETSSTYRKEPVRFAFEFEGHARRTAERLDLGRGTGSSSGGYRQYFSFERGTVVVSYAEVEPCQCEHIEHFELDNTTHRYQTVPAGAARAVYVGPVCDACAAGHMAAYLTPGRGD